MTPEKLTPAPVPSPLPVYTFSGEGAPDPAEWPTATEVTADGAALYHFTGDVAGEAAKGDGLGGVWTLYTGEQAVVVEDTGAPETESSNQIAAAAPLDPPPADTVEAEPTVTATAEPTAEPAPTAEQPEQPEPDATVVQTVTDANGTPIAEVTVTPDTSAVDETGETNSTDPTGNVDTATPAPDPQTVALDAPAPPPAADDAELPQATVASTGVARILSRVEGDIDLYDMATGEAPDPDSLFDRPWDYANIMVCTKRLIERVYVGPFAMATDRLLLPAGAQVPIPHAEAIVARLKAQQAAASTPEEPPAS